MWHHDLCAQAWMDILLLRAAAVAQSQEHNNAARTRLEQIRDETVLTLWEADKTLYAPAGHRHDLRDGFMKRVLPFLFALAVILTAREATTTYKPVTAEAWHAFGVEAASGL